MLSSTLRRKLIPPRSPFDPGRVDGWNAHLPSHELRIVDALQLDSNIMGGKPL